VFGSWSSASANLLRVTDIGTIVGGYDGLGLFGTPGADLIGDSYEAVFTFDLSAVYGVFNNGGADAVYGGTVFGGSPFVNEVVMINGVSRPPFGPPMVGPHVRTAQAGEIAAENVSTFSAQYHYASTVTELATPGFDALAEQDSADYYYAMNGSIPLDFTRPGRYTSANYLMYAYFDAFAEYDNLNTGESGGNWTSIDATLSSVTITAPEPSTWAMMLLSFAGLGFAGYRTSHKAASIA
jgi:hypothetical protein